MGTPPGFPEDPQSLLKALHHAQDLFRECRMSSMLESQNFRPRTKPCCIVLSVYRGAK